MVDGGKKIHGLRRTSEKLQGTATVQERRRPSGIRHTSDQRLSSGLRRTVEELDEKRAALSLDRDTNALDYSSSEATPLDIAHSPQKRRSSGLRRSVEGLHEKVSALSLGTSDPDRSSNTVRYNTGQSNIGFSQQRRSSGLRRSAQELDAKRSAVSMGRNASDQDLSSHQATGRQPSEMERRAKTRKSLPGLRSSMQRRGADTVLGMAMRFSPFVVFRGLRKNRAQAVPAQAPSNLAVYQEHLPVDVMAVPTMLTPQISDDLEQGEDQMQAYETASVPNSVEDEEPLDVDMNEGLVEARLVTEDTAIQVLQEARAVGDSNFKNPSPRESPCTRVGCGVLMYFLSLSAFVSLLAFFGQANEVEVPPTTEPSMSPSSSPTALLDDLILDLPAYTQESLQQHGTPQWMAMTWLSDHPNITALAEWRRKQLFALATFFYSFEGPHWPDLIRDRWLQHTKDECLWFSSEFGDFNEEGDYAPQDAYGARPCNEKGEFQALVLGDLQLSGRNPVIPPEISLLSSLATISLPKNSIAAPLTNLLTTELMQMTHLRLLSLHTNLLYGTLPSEIGLLQHLNRFSLHGNEISGSIPSEVAHLTSIKELILGENLLSGSIPTEFGLMTQMRGFTLYTNSLTGTIISELAMMTNLEHLMIQNNLFTGSLPLELGSMVSLRELTLSNNQLTGSLLSELGSLTSMEWLHLYGNFLSSTIPTELGQLTSLVELDVSSNDLTGSIASDIGRMRNLTLIHLWGNSLTSTIPSEFGQMDQLVVLDLALNVLSGVLPSQLGSMTDMEVALLWGNVLSGSLPSTLGLLSNLKTLVLGSNLISGPIISEAGLLQDLSFLSLTQNAFSGTIPSELSSLTSLVALTLAHNRISGPFPTSMTQNENLTTLYLQSNELSGVIPTEIGAMTNMRQLFLGANSWSGEVPSELGLLSLLVELDLSGLPLVYVGGPSDSLELLLVPMTSTLGYLNLTGSSDLTGAIPDALCHLQDPNCTYYTPFVPSGQSCTLVFDCSEEQQLCGCHCPCVDG